MVAFCFEASDGYPITNNYVIEIAHEMPYYGCSGNPIPTTIPKVFNRFKNLNTFKMGIEKEGVFLGNIGCAPIYAFRGNILTTSFYIYLRSVWLVTFDQRGSRDHFYGRRY